MTVDDARRAYVRKFSEVLLERMHHIAVDYLYFRRELRQWDDDGGAQPHEDE